MFPLPLLSWSFISLSIIHLSRAATADQWRGRSIYQIITDRFALENGTTNTACDPGAQTWCGGTWKAIEQKLDYIQNAGFTAIWISPTSQNWLGPRTPYGDAYTGYWVQDISQLNDHFGTSDDLKSLSAALHSRGMYLMVDVVANNVMALSTNPDYSQYFIKDPTMYHPYCPVAWGNRTSEMDCWLGDTNVTLPDLNTTNPTVMSQYQSWISSFVSEFQVDGLRIDAAKHVDPAFWPGFCSAAGVFCMGEVFGSDVGEASSYQQVLDSVLNYPIYDALVQAFSIPGISNMTGLLEVQKLSAAQYKDVTLLGNFLENQDNPRWLNFSVDPQSLYNAMVWNFMSDGIPIVYYGQEQGLSGAGDPWNREPLWPKGYTNSTTYELIASLNQIRNYLVNQTNWATTQAQVITQTDQEIAFIKGSLITVLTSIGSPPANASVTVYTPWSPSSSVTELLSCEQFVVGSNNTLSVSYIKGGKANIFMQTSDLSNTPLCSNTGSGSNGGSGVANSLNSGALSRLASGMSLLLISFAFFLIQF